MVVLVDALERVRGDDHRSASDPVARVHEQIADAPAVLPDQEVVNMTDLAVAGMNVVPGALLDAVERALGSCHAFVSLGSAPHSALGKAQADAASAPAVLNGGR